MENFPVLKRCLTSTPKNIVVRGTNWVGDAVMTIPALREIRRLFPSAQITLASRSWAKGLFAGAEFIDELQIHEGSGLRSVVQQVRQWRKQNFDLAVLLPNSLETALVASLARVPLRIGYATDGRQALLTHPLEVPEWRNSKHEVFYYLKIVAELEWLIKREQTFLNTQPDGSLEISIGRQAAARDFLRARGVKSISDGRALVALCPGSINSRAKRWPVERYAALGRATLVIFGPTNPLTTRPFSPLGEILRQPPDCAPCMLRDCPIDHRCMTAISPNEVFERARVSLSKRNFATETQRHRDLQDIEKGAV